MPPLRMHPGQLTIPQTFGPEELQLRESQSGGFTLFACSVSAALQLVCSKGGMIRTDNSVRCLFLVALADDRAPSPRSREAADTLACNLES